MRRCPWRRRSECATFQDGLRDAAASEIPVRQVQHQQALEALAYELVPARSRRRRSQATDVGRGWCSVGCLFPRGRRTCGANCIPASFKAVPRRSRRALGSLRTTLLPALLSHPVGMMSVCYGTMKHLLSAVGGQRAPSARSRRYVVLRSGRDPLRGSTTRSRGRRAVALLPAPHQLAFHRGMPGYKPAPLVERRRARPAGRRRAPCSSRTVTLLRAARRSRSSARHRAVNHAVSVRPGTPTAQTFASTRRAEAVPSSVQLVTATDGHHRAGGGRRMAALLGLERRESRPRGNRAGAHRRRRVGGVRASSSCTACLPDGTVARRGAGRERALRRGGAGRPGRAT